LSESYIEVDTKKLDEFIKGISKNAYVDIGILQGDIHPNSKVSTAFIGAVHEFGTDRAGRGNNVTIPERSFIRMPLIEKGEEIQKFAEKELEKNLADGDIEKILSMLGEGAVAKIQEAFETGGFGKWPPLSEVTIERKGSSAILIDQGFLRKRISYKVGGNL
jgi:phage gpG-like protein